MVLRSGKKRKAESEENTACTPYSNEGTPRKQRRERKSGICKNGEQLSGKRSGQSKEIEEKTNNQKKIPRREENRAGVSSVSAGSTRKVSVSVTDLLFHHEIGRGGFGKVFLASCVKGGKAVAVKVIRKNEVGAGSIRRERRVLEKAAECPFLCHGLAAFQSQTHVFLVMQHLPGGTLENYMNVTGLLEESTAKFYSMEIILGLEFLHERDIIHRDLKPSNIMFDEAGHVKIVDFGLVMENVNEEKKTQGMLGTYVYTAPEVIFGALYATSVDWWAFGVILYQMLTGKLPFYIGDSKDDFYNTVASDDPRYPGWLSPEPRAILSELLEKNPEQRLGVVGKIKNHPFYSGMNWEDLKAQTLQPPSKTLEKPPLDRPSKIQESFSFLQAKNCSTYFGSFQTIPGLSFTSPRWRDLITT